MEETKKDIVIDDSENRLTQKKIVLSHLVQYGCITDKEARNLYSISRLAAVIGRLKNDGYAIKTEDMHGINSTTGNPCKYAMYTMVTAS